MGKMIRSAREQERERLYNLWEETLRRLDECHFNLEEVIKGIQDTYHFFAGTREFNSVLRIDLPIFRNLCQIEAFNYCPEDCKQYEFTVCINCISGLIWAIENAFARGYYVDSLPLEIKVHNSNLEADMSSYDAYKKALAKMMKMYREEFLKADIDD